MLNQTLGAPQPSARQHDIWWTTTSRREVEAYFSMDRYVSQALKISQRTLIKKLHI